MKTQYTPRAFTLIELLAVITIIGILAAIIIPVAAHVRKTAQLARCTANMRSIATAVLLFTQDNRGNLPIANQTYSKGEGHWYKQVAPYIQSRTGTGSSGIGNSIGCPRAPKFKAANTDDNIGASYGWNAIGYSGNLIPPTQTQSVPVTAIPNPTRFIMIGERLGINNGTSYARDTNWGLAPPFSSAPIDGDAIPAGPLVPGAVRLSHNKKSNYAFFDAHVRLLAPQETYTGDGNSNTLPNMWKGL
ncbi:MAG: prepilin-type N-terminal cleavage/methylation domain-containing protein [Opitutaceae bacterium]|jgi:general secretion pathway protein G|nr:prepilin-type N-terminal cleavage/methylation domain-containing protein [Opitutaceae bacterium]